MDYSKKKNLSQVVDKIKSYLFAAVIVLCFPIR